MLAGGPTKKRGVYTSGAHVIINSYLANSNYTKAKRSNRRSRRCFYVEDSNSLVIPVSELSKCIIKILQPLIGVCRTLAGGLVKKAVLLLSSDISEPHKVAVGLVAEAVVVVRAAGRASMDSTRDCLSAAGGGAVGGPAAASETSSVGGGAARRSLSRWWWWRLPLSVPSVPMHLLFMLLAADVPVIAGHLLQAKVAVPNLPP